MNIRHVARVALSVNLAVNAALAAMSFSVGRHGWGLAHLLLACFVAAVMAVEPKA